MKKLRVLSFVLIFICCAAIVFAVKAQEIPPWMEDIESSNRGTYLVPKGARRKVIGSQIIVEPSNEYVARRLYEIEGAFEKRFKMIEENQEKFQTEFEDLKQSITELKNNHWLDQDLAELKSAIEELSVFKRKMEDTFSKESVEGSDVSGETVEDARNAAEEEFVAEGY